ncbi:MAG: gliding motility-associated C-terminal domain-containing protein [Chitinophagaceae bacterium]
MSLKPAVALLLLFLFGRTLVLAQPCTQLGQTPSTAFPVCGTTTFNQVNVPICATNDLFVPGCSGTGNLYQNKNPFFYKFTCFVSGTLGFLITPAAANEDYDWQLYDITGHDPNDIFTDPTLVVTGNWAGTYGVTGASASGVGHIQCGSTPSDNMPTFAQMPNLIAGHTYLLMISHFSDTQSGYALSFGGGTGVITDPAIPHMQSAKPDCDGKKLTLKLNKKIRCNTLTPTGSEFSISPAVTTVTGVTTTSCAAGFDFDEITITLASALPNGNYDLVINNGTPDGNTLLDYCDNSVPAGEKINFQYFIPVPIFADSVGRVGCAPQEVKIYFPKKIDCSTIAADGSDFAVTGPAPVTVIGANGNCVDGKSDVITVRFASPVYVKGTYQVMLKAGTDGSTATDECGVVLPVHSRPFTAVDTVFAAFTYNIEYDCRSNTLHFSHNGAHDVNNWTWTFNGDSIVHTQTHTMDFPSSGDNTVQLIVSNGICSDTVTNTISFDNEVKAAFTMPPIICPEDPLNVTNTCTGQIDAWRWSFDAISSSTAEHPLPVLFPQNDRESYYTIKLVAINHTLGCSDSVKQTLRVLSNCFIAVPTAFTPNGDGLNDYLSPNNAFKADNLQFSVFNRWGQLVFTTRNWQEKWDGKIKGLPQGSGVYVWFLSYTHRDTGQKVLQKGTTTLIR